MKEEKPVRKAVRCILIKDGKVVVTKYKIPNKKAGYYELPGGKIEEGETTKQAAIREFQEETGMLVSDLQRRGHMTIEYPNRIFSFEVFIAKTYSGEPTDFPENSSEWIEILDVLAKEKKLAVFILLDPFIIEAILLKEDKHFSMKIWVDESEMIQKIDYQVEEK